MMSPPISRTLVLTDNGAMLYDPDLAGFDGSGPVPPPSFSVAPSISGTATVGQTLTGADGTVENGTVTGRQWLLAGVPITGATGSSFTPTQAGLHVLQVTATGPGGSVTASSAAVAVVAAPPAPVFTAQPSIAPSAGSAGQTFTATDGTASNATGITRRWLLSGVAIGTGATVTPVVAGSLVLENTATGPGGATVEQSAAVTVAAGATPSFKLDRSYVMVSKSDAPNSVVLNLIDVPSGATVALAGPNQSLLYVDAETTPGTRPVKLSPLAVVTPSTVYSNLDITVGGEARKLLMMLVDRTEKVDKFRNVIDVQRNQAWNDYVAREAMAELVMMRAMPKTDVAIKSGNFFDPTIWNTGRVPTGIAPVTYPTWNWSTGAWDQMPYGTSVIDVGNFDVEIDDDCSFDTITNSGTGTITVVARNGKSPKIHCSRLRPIAGGWYEERIEDPEYKNSDGRPRINVVFGGVGRLGRMVMGAANYRMGVVKTHRAMLSQTIPQGATTIHIPGIAGMNWDPHDELYLPSTRDCIIDSTDPTYIGPTHFWSVNAGGSQLMTQTEGFVRNTGQHVRLVSYDPVTEIATIDRPTTEEHVYVEKTVYQGQTLTKPVEVWNLTRAIVYDSANPSSVIQPDGTRRADDMVMWNADHNNSFVRHRCMGGTALDPSLCSPDGTILFDRDPSDPARVQVTDPHNTIASYSRHVHNMGTERIDEIAVDFGNVDDDGDPDFAPPNSRNRGVGSKTHGSKHSVRSCLFVGQRCIGWGTEDGPEETDFEDNGAAGQCGDGFLAATDTRDCNIWKHNGHAGVCFEGQSRVGSFNRNSGFASNDVWRFKQQNSLWGHGLLPPNPVKNLLLCSPQVTSMRYNSPFNPVQDQYTQDYYGYARESANPYSFDGNIVVGSRNGIHIYDRDNVNRCDQTPFLFSRLFDHGCIHTFYSDSYVNSYYWWCCVSGNNAQPAAGTGAKFLFDIGGATWGINLANIHFYNVDVGIDKSAIAPDLNGWNIDITGENTRTLVAPTSNSSRHSRPKDGAGNPVSDPSLVIANNVMGQTYSADGSTANPTGFEVIWRNYGIIFSDQPATLQVGYPCDSGGYKLGPPNGVDPRPAGSRPVRDFWLDPSSYMRMPYGTDRGTPGAGGTSPVKSLNILGYIFDSVGPMTYGAWLNPDSLAAGPGDPTFHGLYKFAGQSGADIITRNKCFVDADCGPGEVKVRTWNEAVDRAFGIRFQYPLDVILTATPDAIRDANLTTDPTETKVTDLRAELIRTARTDFLRRDMTKPVVLTTGTITVHGNDVLRQQVSCTDPLGTLAVVGGADAAAFAFDGTYLVRAANPTGQGSAVGSFDAGNPTDADHDNAYQITVAVTSPAGVASDPVPITVAVAAPIITIDFNRTGPAGNLPGQDNGYSTDGLYFDGNGNLAYAGHSMWLRFSTDTSARHFVDWSPADRSFQMVLAQNAAYSAAVLVYGQGNQLKVLDFGNGPATEIISMDINPDAWDGAHLAHAEYDNGQVTITMGDHVVTGTSRLTDGHYVGWRIDAGTSPIASVLTSFRFGALT